MAVPTITSITPSRGHSGGGFVARIVGTNFQQQAAPGPGIPAPAAPVAVRVTIGGVECVAGICSDTEIDVIIPGVTPAEISTTVTADVSTDEFTAIAHGLFDGDLAVLEGDFPTPIDTAVAHFVVAATSDTFQLSLTLGGAAIDLLVLGAAPLLVKTEAHFDLVIENIDAAGVLIPGETVTLAGAWVPERPDLADEAHVTTVFRAFVEELQRQVIDNVSWAVHTDYDEDTGDIDVAFLPELPGVAVVDLNFKPSDSDRGDEEEISINDPTGPDGDFAVKRAPEIVNMSGGLLCASNNPLVTLNLFQAMRTFFNKTTRVVVPRDPSDLGKGTIEYELEGDAVADVSMARQTEGSNIVWFMQRFTVFGIRIEHMYGVTTTPHPKAGTLHPENTVEVGKTATVVTVTTEPLD